MTDTVELDMKDNQSSTRNPKSMIPRQIRKAAKALFRSQVRERFQAQRANLFLDLVQPQHDIAILDLGGGSGHFPARIRDRIRARFTVADIESRHAHAAQGHGLHFVLLEEDGPLPFKDDEFDVVFCNSVIEHVTLPKELCLERMDQREWRSRSWDRQKQFADEIRRISKAYFVQTPHKGFPIEAHSWLPFANWCSHNHMLALQQFADRFWFRRWRYVDWNLLGIEDLQSLFPDAQIYVERILGLPKSIIAYNKPKLAPSCER